MWCAKGAAELLTEIRMSQRNVTHGSKGGGLSEKEKGSFQKKKRGGASGAIIQVCKRVTKVTKMREDQQNRTCNPQNARKPRLEETKGTERKND